MSSIDHPFRMPLPETFTQTIIELNGDKGLAWLNELPSLLADCAQRWWLTLQPPFNLSYNYVAPAIRADGTEVVLKVGVPNPELLTEIAALQFDEGYGMARLLEAEPERGILLLERLKPGTTLASLADDRQATTIAAGVMRQLWRPLPPDHPFPSVAKWAKGLERLRQHYQGGTGPFPTYLVEAAERLFDDLIASMAEPVLLHGDLHHENILAAGRQPWLAIDPKGLAGEPAYEVGALLRNPIPQLYTWPDLNRITVRRIDQLAEELELDRERLIGWGLAQAVLSAWWTVEDHGREWDDCLILAEILASLRP
jgi:streptomycin 6-kinase